MRRETWLADRVEVSVSGFFTTHHVLRTSAGVVGELTLPALPMRGIFQTADGRELVMERSSWWRGTHELREGGRIVGTARAKGVFRHEFVVDLGDQSHELEAAGFWGRVWHLLDGTGEMVVEIRPRGFFGRGATLRILKPVDVDLLGFTHYLVRARWQEQAVAAAS